MRCRVRAWLSQFPRVSSGTGAGEIMPTSLHLHAPISHLHAWLNPPQFQQSGRKQPAALRLDESGTAQERAGTEKKVCLPGEGHQPKLHIPAAAVT
ncbi:hypothetical protein BaRGS_00006662 [Batillaria attramentaria]|uniref:Uncharacterized protein n=1 Tax=Batillaria attramentaria TaxID=370345 RepID=A0ABD0LQX3_9CAEN